jgi:hypothetical protein
MSDSRDDVGAKLEAVLERLDALERRVSRLEVGGEARARQAREPRELSDVLSLGATAEVDAADRKPIAGGATILAMIGRVVVALAGAFLLRAFTERGLLPQEAGAVVGLLYACVWIAVADWAAGHERRTSATFHGVAAAVIAYPLLFEATARFGFLRPTVAAAALAGVTLLGLLAAHRRGLRRLAWVFTTGATATALVLSVALRQPVLFGAVLLLVGIAALWVGYRHGWRGPAWLAAGALDGLVLLTAAIVLMADSPQAGEVARPGAVVALQLALLLAYLGSFAVDTLARRRDLFGTEIGQGVVAIVAGLGGAMTVAHAAHLSTLPIGSVALLLAILCYAVSFAFIDQAHGSRRNFVAFTTAALLFAVLACEELIGGAPRALVLAAIALATAWIAASRQRATLGLHAAVYATAAAVASGLLVGAVRALFVPGVERLELGPVALGTLAAIAVCCWFPAVTHGRTWSGRVASAPRVLLLTLLFLGVGGTIVTFVAPLFGSAGAGLGPGKLAPLRTGVLAASAIAAAWLGRRERFVEARWLTYPLLLVGGAKILAEEAMAGNAATIFVSLALYGTALILTPRLLRRD